MTNAQLLVGSLSNDLFRVANLIQRDSLKGARRFLVEAQKWAQELQKEDVAPYIKTIAHEIHVRTESDISMSDAEDYLMYGILLQNYALKAMDHGTV